MNKFSGTIKDSSTKWPRCQNRFFGEKRLFTSVEELFQHENSFFTDWPLVVNQIWLWNAKIDLGLK